MKSITIDTNKPAGVLEGTLFSVDDKPEMVILSGKVKDKYGLTSDGWITISEGTVKIYNGKHNYNHDKPDNIFTL